MSSRAPAPSVSIVIPTLNSAATVGDTLRSVLSQRWSGTAPEVIVVDGGSTDRTLDVVSRFPVRLLHEPIRGPAAARNKGLFNAMGEIYVSLDSDTLPTRRWLEHLVAPLADPRVHQVAGAVAGYRPTTPAEKYAQARGSYSRAFTVDSKWCSFAACINMAVRRADALAIGGWRNEFTSGEDPEFSIRLLQRFPSKISWAAQAVVFHRHRMDEGAMARQASWWGEGAGMVFRAHPEVKRWTAVSAARLRLAMFCQSCGAAACARLAKIGLVSQARADFERCHRIWLSGFWAGFAKGLRRPALESIDTPRGLMTAPGKTIGQLQAAGS